MRREKKELLSRRAASGMVALVFLVLGFQLAVFFIKVVERPVKDAPVPQEQMLDGRDGGESRLTPDAPGKTEKKDAYRYSRPSGAVRPAAGKGPVRTCESFAFDPNTVTTDDLQRLGLSGRQAATIENYRTKGGRFRSKADFQKMYVVSDTLFTRLEPFIDIPKLELNAADSAALVGLRGIGPYYARKILAYRDRLGGFCDKAQLLEIEGIDDARYAGFADEVVVDAAKCRRFDLWNVSDSVLARHPYIGAKGARSIVRYKQVYDSARWTLPELAKEGALPSENIEKLKKYIVIQ